MKLRVVSWNMGCSPPNSPYRRTHQRAWHFLLDKLKPDVALVQEAMIDDAPPWVREGHRRVDGHDKGCDFPRHNLPSRLLLVREELSAKRIPDIHAKGCCLAAAEIVLPTDVAPLVAVSAHVSTRADEGRQQRDYLEALINAVAPLASRRRCVLGGDFNASREYDEKYYGPFFDELGRRGFHDAHRAIHGHDVSTFWGHQAPEGGVQDDHIFVDAPSASRVLKCYVVDNKTVRELSDHGPVVLDMR